MYEFKCPQCGSENLKLSANIKIDFVIEHGRIRVIENAAQLVQEEYLNRGLIHIVCQNCFHSCYGTIEEDEEYGPDD